MISFVKRLATVLAVAVGLLLGMQSIASADHHPAAGHVGADSSPGASTVQTRPEPLPADGASADDSLNGGIQLLAPVYAPVTISGNALSVLGTAVAADDTDPQLSGGSDASGNINNGIQAIVPIHVPIEVSNLAIGVLGNAFTD